MKQWQEAAKWFFDITGLEEHEWLERRHESIVAKANTSDMFIKNIHTGTELPAGHFSTHTINELLLPIAAKNTIPFHIHTQGARKFKKHVDTAHLQAYAPPHTMFQVASNFNCAEVPSPHTCIDSGYFVSNLAFDHTQGPAAWTGWGAIARRPCP